MPEEQQREGLSEAAQVQAPQAGYIDGKVADLLVKLMTPAEAMEHCATLPGCAGFTFQGPPDLSDRTWIFFKREWIFYAQDGAWSSYQSQATCCREAVAPPPAAPAAAAMAAPVEAELKRSCSMCCHSANPGYIWEDGNSSWAACPNPICRRDGNNALQQAELEHLCSLCCHSGHPGYIWDEGNNNYAACPSCGRGHNSLQNERRVDPMLDNAVVTLEQMRVMYNSQHQGLTAAQKLAHWNNLRVASQAEVDSLCCMCLDSVRPGYILRLSLEGVGIWDACPGCGSSRNTASQRASGRVRRPSEEDDGGCCAGIVCSIQ